MPLFATIAGLCYGAILGSFLGCSWYRIPRKISLSEDRSFCPSCQTPISWYNNIPIASWLLLRGKSSCCQNKLSPSYLILEVAGALFLGAIGYFAGLVPMLVVLGAAIIVTVIISAVTRRSVDRDGEQ